MIDSENVSLVKEILLCRRIHVEDVQGKRNGSRPPQMCSQPSPDAISKTPARAPVSSFSKTPTDRIPTSIL